MRSFQSAKFKNLLFLRGFIISQCGISAPQDFNQRALLAMSNEFTYAVPLSGCRTYLPVFRVRKQYRRWEKCFFVSCLFVCFFGGRGGGGDNLTEQNLGTNLQKIFEIFILEITANASYFNN